MSTLPDRLAQAYARLTEIGATKARTGYGLTWAAYRELEAEETRLRDEVRALLDGERI
jgi:hypothetical protein